MILFLNFQGGFQGTGEASSPPKRKHPERYDQGTQYYRDRSYKPTSNLHITFMEKKKFKIMLRTEKKREKSFLPLY